MSSLFFISCSFQKKIGREADQAIFSNGIFAPAHIGICIYDPAEKKYLYNYQGDKYFIPASNTKLLTCYAAMKYLGDSLTGLRYEEQSSGNITIEGTGDPTFLHPDFKIQPVYDFLKQHSSVVYLQANPLDRVSPLGRGWGWDDYNDDYLAERSVFPIYGNCAEFYWQADTVAVCPPALYDSSLKTWNKTLRKEKERKFSIVRKWEENSFSPEVSRQNFSSQSIPFKTNTAPFFSRLLEDTTGCQLKVSTGNLSLSKIIHSQPTDTLLKIMMHRSDNFFAEQSLLMVSEKMLGFMDDEKIIDTLLRTDYQEMPQKPKWVDGSGLSRYNLISPQDFVFVLGKIKNEFDWDRITTLLATGNSGTLSGYYKDFVGRIYAKTGSLSNNLSLSGYITTNKGKQLIFSVMINNHQASASAIRRAVEKFLTTVMVKN
jgi:D-alanyl-D-alanine carboxypeptidase/D-alanyl-D-alanine-endopeptidase (penicillin-binding protein 4)